MLFEKNFAVGIRPVGLLAGVAGIALVSAPSTAAETCEISLDQVTCTEPGDTDIFALTTNWGGSLDGAYDSLDEKIAQTAPTEADTQAAQDAIDAADKAATDLSASNVAVNDALTQANQDAFTAVETAKAAVASAQEAEDAAALVQSNALAAKNLAAGNVTAAGVAVADAGDALADAQIAVEDAQLAYDNSQTAANLTALNSALAARTDAQANLAAAEEKRLEAIEASVGVENELAAADASLAETVAATTAAQTKLSESQTALTNSLSSNAKFVEAITEAGYSADAVGLASLEADVDAANSNLALAEAGQAALDDTSKSFIRAREVLVPAAENQNPAIAAASQALLGDPRAAETNSEVEVIAALVDHEARISSNAEAIATETTARIAADTALANRIDAIDVRLEDFDDRIASSTATAIALGGMAFLPGMKFNLAVAGGTYDGAQAVAANVGVRVSENVAVTAGVGGGLNKRGKVAGRVGFIVGW